MGPILYDFLAMCWNTQPSKRPTFSEICTRMDAMLQILRVTSVGTDIISQQIESFTTGTSEDLYEYDYQTNNFHGENAVAGGNGVGKHQDEKPMVTVV